MSPPPPRPLFGRLVGATVHYGLGGLLPQLVGFLLFPLYTHVLSTAENGANDVANSLAVLLALVMRAGVPGAVTRFYFDHTDGEGLRDYVTTVFVGLFASSLLVAAVALGSAPVWMSSGAAGLSLVQIGLVVLAAILSVPSDLQRRLVQAREQARYASRLNLTSSAVGIAFQAFFVLGLRWGVTGMLLAQVAQSAAFGVQALLYLRPDLRGRVRMPMFRESVAYGITVLPSHVVVALAPVLIAAVLAGTDGVGAVGLLGVARRLTSPLTIAGTAFSTAFSPIYFSLRKDPDGGPRIVQLMGGTWAAGVVLALGIATAGPPVIVWLTPPSYHEAAGLVPILALAFLGQLLTWLFCNEMFYAKRTWFVPLMTSASIAVTVVGTIALAPRWGAVGAAIATAAGQAAGAAVAVATSVKLVTLPHRWRGMLLAGAFGAALYWGCAWSTDGVPLARFAVGTASCLALPLALWLAGDEVTRELVAWARRRLAEARGAVD